MEMTGGMRREKGKDKDRGDSRSKGKKNQKVNYRRNEIK